MNLSSQLLCLSEPHRWRILATLWASREPLTPTLLAQVLALTPDQTSHHLKILLKHDLIIYLRSGGNSLYSPARPVVETLRQYFTNSFPENTNGAP